MSPPTRRSPRSRPSPEAAEPNGTFDAATRQQIDAVVAALHELYPDADCELAWETPLDLLIATILSAQSTDARVNQVTRDLFSRYRTASDYADADVAELEEEIRSTGFYRQKAKNLIGAGEILRDRFAGEVPRTIDELTEVPGAARKTANVVLGTAYGIPSGFVVDTHVKRLAHRLGLSAETRPEKIESDLMARIPRDEWIFAAHALIWHGRRVCHARRPQCGDCGLADHCPRNGL
ncbi:MAG: endonuclease III [Acidobacteria bacterium]|nr:MAG: endonuclease III [Acidobacteriota bacterium]REK00242.1 MAG: endonuclease III [Acidobacteriota bacterium]